MSSMAKLLNPMSSSCPYAIVIYTVFFTSGWIWVHSATLESDIEILRSIKLCVDSNTIPRISYLSTWDFAFDPCENTGDHFFGILCTNPVDNSSFRISVIDLDSAGYDGHLSPDIGKLTELTYLSLENNKFRMPIPDSITDLVKLTTLSLSGNSFTGNIPTGFHRLKKLETLDLSSNLLTGSLNASTLRFRRLKLLSLANNGFRGRIPDLFGLWQLTVLDLSNNFLSGPLPRLPLNLQSLYLNHNALTGHISSIRKLQDLRVIDLSNNRFSGSIHHGIVTLPRVIHLNVSANAFTLLEVIRFADRETQLQVLDAHRNNLRGRLPGNLVTVGNLTRINLSQNQFFGVIPVQYGIKLEGSWQSLYLDHNFLIGNLPPQFNRSIVRVSGSLAQNCLKCPIGILWCNGGQRPDSECALYNHIFDA